MRRYGLSGRTDRGASAVEFALTLPVFIILFIGIIEFGWYFFVQHTIQYATREGMRLALVGRTLPGPGGNPMTREASIIQTIRNNAALAVNPARVTVYIYPVTSASAYQDPANWQDYGSEEGNPNAGGTDDYRRVRSTYDHRFFTPLIGSFFGSGNTVTIRAEGTYRNERFD